MRCESKGEGEGEGEGEGSWGERSWRAEQERSAWRTNDGTVLNHAKQRGHCL